MMDDLIFFRDEKFFFDTKISESDFVKARFAEKIRENGVLAEFSDGAWNFLPYHFDFTVSAKDAAGSGDTIFLCGDGFAGETFCKILKNSADEAKISAADKIFSAMDEATEKNLCVDGIGAGGIFLSADFCRILFLPKIFVVAAAANLSAADSAEFQGFFVNSALTKKQNVRYFQAVTVYRILSGEFPFAAENESVRNDDLRDGNFIPLKFLVAADEKISEFCDAAFCRKDCEFPRKEFRAYKKTEISSAEKLKIQREKEKFLCRKKKSVEKKRWFRGKSVAIKIFAAAAAIFAIVFVSLYRSSMEKRTTKGLTSFETVEMFFSAVNTLDADSARNCSGKKLSRIVDRISNTFVSCKARSVYEPLLETVPPAVYFTKKIANNNIYGLAQFFIDGIQGDLFFEGPRKNSRPDELIQENGGKISDGDEKIYSVEFFILDSSGEDALNVTKQTQKIRVKYEKNRWIVDDAEIQMENRFMRYSEFQKKWAENFDYAEISAEFDFLPTESEILQAEKYSARKDILQNVQN